MSYLGPSFDADCSRMLAVMTMNVGYFCSVLAGAFLGELGVRRYI